MKIKSLIKHNLMRAAMTLALILACAAAWAGTVTVNIIGSGTVNVTYNGTTTEENINSGWNMTLSGSLTLIMIPAQGYTLQELQMVTNLGSSTESTIENNGVYTYTIENVSFYDITYTVVFSIPGVTTYTLTGDGMTFSVEGQTVTSAEEGQRVDITLPSPGNHSYWVVTSSDVAIQKDDANHFHFTMPAKSVIVNAQQYYQTACYVNDESTHGHVMVNGNNAGTENHYADETITLTPVADAGYEYLPGTLTATNINTNESINLTDNGDGTWSFTMPNSQVSVSATFSFDPAHITMSGNEYTIHTATGWNVFCDLLEGGESFSGKTVKLGANISITQSAGSAGHEFMGTFDGDGKTLTVDITETTTQGTAPFREINGATIQNLVVTGSVVGTTHAAGLVGYARGDNANTVNTITNCKVATNVTVTTPNSAGNYHCGGVVGHAIHCTLNMSNTVYCGDITNSGNYVGGLQGWSDGNTINFSHCLFAGSYSGTASFHPVAVRNNNNATTASVSHVYYTVTPTLTNSSFIATDGTKTISRATAPATIGNLTQSLNFMSTTIYQNGICYNNLYYATIGLPSGGTDIYLIDNADDWLYFCEMLNDNATWNHFSGKTVKLGANITVTQMAGGSNHAFTGTFNGNHKTLTLNYGTVQAPIDAEFVAPFPEVRGGAEFINLNIDGHIYAAYTGSSDPGVGGLIGHLFGGITIEGCTSTVEINSTKDRVGGFVGLCEDAVTFTNCKSSAVVTCTGSGSGFVGWSRDSNYTIAFYGCLFNGKVLKKNGVGSGNGGFVGWKGYKKTVEITNCLVDPAAVAEGETMADNNSATFCRYSANTSLDNQATTITNCYYTETFGNAQGTQAHSISGGDYVTVGNAGTVSNNYTTSGLTFYNVGLKCGNVLYAAENNAVSLTLAHQDREGYDFIGYTATAGNLNGSTLTMPDENVTINAEYTCTAPSGLTATDITATTATLNWNGLQESYSVRYLPVILYEGFESGTMPDGWTRTGVYWEVTSGTGYYTGAATGNYNAGCFNNVYYDLDTLITPVMDLGDVASATLSFNFWNTDYDGDINILNVYYRVDEGEWQSLYTYENATEGWIPITINLEGMAANYQIGFECESHYSYGMGIDDVMVIGNGAWTTENNVLYPFTLTGLTPETQYLWQVQGLDCDGNGSTTEWSAATFTTLSPCEVAPSELTATDITFTTATLNWNGLQESYNVRCRTDGANEWQTIGGIAATTTTLSGLLSGTTYEWQVQGLDCDGNGGTTEWSAATFTTLSTCEVQPSELTATDITATTATLNWNGSQESYNVRYQPVVILNEGFESGTMPDGWTSTGSYWQVTSGTGHYNYTGAATGNYNAGCYINSSNRFDILITPVMDLGNVASATLSFNFWNNRDGYGEYNILKVHYRVDEGEWHLLYTYGNPTNRWIPVTINLEGMAAHYQIGFEYESHYSYGMGIDDVKVIGINTSEWTTVTNVSSPHNLTGLTPETQYVWQVQGLECNGEGSTTEWSESGTFTTLSPCEVAPSGLTATSTATTATLNWNDFQESYSVRYLPFILYEGFESGTMPDGWTRTGSYWQITSGTGYYDHTGAATGNYNAGCFIGNYVNSDILITPVMDLGNVASATLSFNFWNTNWYGDINTLNVYYRVNGGEWQSLYTNNDETEGWIPVTINLEGMAAHYQIGFECKDHNSYGMGIDDVMVTGINTSEWTTVTNVSSPHNLTGLTPETQYLWQVQGLDCDGEGSTTEWSEMGIFTTLAGIDLTVAGYEEGNGGWVFIASPVAGSIAPSEVHNLFPSAGETSNDYDLYRFDQSSTNGKEWQNWKQDEGHNNVAPGFSLVNGQGYLYATKETRTLMFAGEYNTGNEFEVPLVYDEGKPLAGWNLVGNPFATGATSSKPFYRMNPEGTALSAQVEAGNTVEAMEGVFVQATGNNQTVSFTAQTRGGEKRAVAALYIQVGPSTGSGTSVLDNAIIRFDGGQTLEKFSFREGSTKLYIPQDGTDYAIACAESTGEMPVNFKAETDGTYTISVNVDNVELAYLHLIDNLTGADIDLLAANGGNARHGDAINRVSTYTFTAKTTDYESRFRLVFSICEDANGDNETFAFIDASGNIIVNGEGTLQMVDVTGRIVLSVVGHTRCVPTTGMTAGVYILRLITGNDVKTQKIVVK